MGTHKCHQILTFGPSKQYISKEMVKLLITLKTLDRKEEELQVLTYLVETDIPLLCGARELNRRWQTKIDNENDVLEIKLEDGKTERFKLIETSGNHIGIELEKSNVENICRKGFNTKGELFEQCDIEHSYVCIDCVKEYNTESDLEDHIREKHSKGKTRYRNKKEYQNIEEHRQKYICDLCNEEFNNESKLKQHGEIDHKIHEENKINYLNGFAALAEDIMNGDKGLEDLQNYITGHRDIELEPTESIKVMGIIELIISYFGNDLELGSEGLVRHAQPKEIRENEKEHKTINRCLQSNGELRKIEKLKSHEEKCYKWCESREDPENNKNEIYLIECEENWECECNQYGKWLVQEKKDRECQKKNEFSDKILTIDKSPTDPIKTEGENPERDKKLFGEPDNRYNIIKKPLQKKKKTPQKKKKKKKKKK